MELIEGIVRSLSAELVVSMTVETSVSAQIVNLIITLPKLYQDWTMKICQILNISMVSLWPMNFCPFKNHLKTLPDKGNFVTRREPPPLLHSREGLSRKCNIILTASPMIEINGVKVSNAVTSTSSSPRLKWQRMDWPKLNISHDYERLDVIRKLRWGTYSVYVGTEWRWICVKNNQIAMKKRHICHFKNPYLVQVTWFW